MNTMETSPGNDDHKFFNFATLAQLAALEAVRSDVSLLGLLHEELSTVCKKVISAHIRDKVHWKWFVQSSTEVYQTEVSGIENDGEEKFLIVRRFVGVQVSREIDAILHDERALFNEHGADANSFTKLELAKEDTGGPFTFDSLPETAIFSLRYFDNEVDGALLEVKDDLGNSTYSFNLVSAAVSVFCPQAYSMRQAASQDLQVLRDFCASSLPVLRSQFTD